MGAFETGATSRSADDWIELPAADKFVDPSRRCVMRGDPTRFNSNHRLSKIACGPTKYPRRGDTAGSAIIDEFLGFRARGFMATRNSM